MILKSSPYPFYITTHGEEIDSFSDVDVWSLMGNGTATEDNTQTIHGLSRGIRLTATSNGADLNYTKTISQRWDGVDSNVIYFYLHTPTTSISAITVWVSSFTHLSKSIYKSIIDPATLHLGWNKFIIKRDDWTVESGESLNNTMIKYRIRVKSSVNAMADVTFHTSNINHKQKPKIILQFDDNANTPFTNAYPILEENNLVATWFVISDRFSKGGYVPLEDVHTLHDAGWTIANHTISHARLDLLSLDEQITEIKGCRDFLLDEGFTRGALHAAYPYGSWNQDTLTAMKQLGMKTGRDGGVAFANYPETVLPFNFKTTYSLSTSTTFETIQTVIDRAIKYGQTITILGHGVSDNPQISTTTHTNVFQDMCEYLVNVGADCVTIDEWYDNLNKTEFLF
jgi:peptidoglycan/xylan/chitin deacetylase (PgdA/CDA1 family)